MAGVDRRMDAYVIAAARLFLLLYHGYELEVHRNVVFRMVSVRPFEGDGLVIQGSNRTTQLIFHFLLCLLFCLVYR